MSTALLVIDVQRELADGLAPSRRTELLTTVAGLIDRARTAGAPVVYVRHGDAELLEGTPAWQIAGEIAPNPGEPIVDKHFCDSFRMTDLHDVLMELAIDRIVVCGMQTEYCVDATIREAERRGYRVTLVEDGTATYPSAEASERQIQAQVHRVARGRFADIVPAEKLFAQC